MHRRSTAAPTAAAPPSRACTDNAGTSARARVSLKYDSTAPSLTPAPARGPDANGRYNTRSRSRSAAPIRPLDRLVQHSELRRPIRPVPPSAARARTSGTLPPHRFAPVRRNAAVYPVFSEAPRRERLVQPPGDAERHRQRRDLGARLVHRRSLGPDSGSASITAVCVDKAGNTASCDLQVRQHAAQLTTSPLRSATIPRRRWSASADARRWPWSARRRNGSPTTLYKGTARSFTDSR